jgi:hypothetical protein
MKSEKSVFDRLSAINVNEHVEKKDNLTYLSWAWAWSVTKKECPDASYTILPTDYDDDLGFMCHTSVTIDGQTLEMWLPVMDGKNKSMKKKAYSYATKYGDKQVDAATTFDINKTLMRCLVKNLAMFGLGIYIYAGEDLPESEPKAVEQSVHKALVTLVKGSDDWTKVLKYVKDNKSKGLTFIGKQLTTQYDISVTLKKEIAELCNQ